MPGHKFRTALAQGHQPGQLLTRRRCTPFVAAQKLGISRSALYRLIEAEHIEASKVGGVWLVYVDSLEEYLHRTLNTQS